MDKRKIITAGTWVILIFGVSQLLRLGSSLIATRLLDPEVFGLMAIVYILRQGVHMFSDLGLWAFVVRHKQGTESFVLNTIWAMQIVRGWFTFILIGLLAFLIYMLSSSMHVNLGGIYGHKLLPMILVIVGFTAVIQGYKTMAPAIASRDLKRGRLELIELISQLVATVCMLVWAWLAPSIWPLVAAAVISAVVNVALTYNLFEYRQRFVWNVEVVKEAFAFGKWIFIATVLTYFAQQGDRLIFANYLSAYQLGVYSIAFMLASVFSNVLQQVSSKIWFPVLSGVVHENREQLKVKYYSIRFKQDIVVFFLNRGGYCFFPNID